jgi:hypothetical protein
MTEKVGRCGALALPLVLVTALACDKGGPDQAAPRCGFKLTPYPIVPEYTFHATRHSTATHLLSRGADVAAVQRIMRHRDPRLTTETYGHLSIGYLQSEADLLSFRPQPNEEPPRQLAAVGAGARRRSRRGRRRTARGAEPCGRGVRGPGWPAEVAVISGGSEGAGYRVRTDDIQLGNGGPAPSREQQSVASIGKH